MIARGKVGLREGGGAQRGNKWWQRLDLGWWIPNVICRLCVIDLYTWNLYGFINQCHLNSIKKFPWLMPSTWLSPERTGIDTLRGNDNKELTANSKINLKDFTSACFHLSRKKLEAECKGMPILQSTGFLRNWILALTQSNNLLHDFYSLALQEPKFPHLQNGGLS